MTFPSSAAANPVWVVVGRQNGRTVLVDLAADGTEVARTTVTERELPARVKLIEASLAPRWVWADTPLTYAPLVREGVRIARAHDLRLVRALLRRGDEASGATASRWDAAGSVPDAHATPALFDLDEGSPSAPSELAETLAEFARQRSVLTSPTAARLPLLAAAESAGALLAGGAPARLEQLGAVVREALDDPGVNLDSQPKLLRALHRAGVLVDTTSRWELSRHEHPVVAPLIEYKKLMRLHTANGEAWVREWVRDGRFRPVYVPAGVVTGRWASSGGGALQIPRQLRDAVRADPGWCFVVADVAQLEPRILAAMSGDTRLADAARGQDLYEGIVRTGAVASRSQAKLALLGAMYGATTGESGRLVPQLRRAFPRAMRLVDDAAATGEAGGLVTTWLGRVCPPPSPAWMAGQSAAGADAASGADQSRARRAARDRGRFTRNFIVQGTAAEWALAWLADLRRRLAAIEPVTAELAARRSGRAFESVPHLAFFLHDEIIVHTPVDRAPQVAAAVKDAADAAGRLLFGDFPIDFRLDLRIGSSAQKD